MPQLSGVSRLRLSPGEVERLLRDEKERRRKLRIIQVRAKAKQVAKSRLEAVRQEKVRQLEKLAEKIEEEWQAEKQNRIQQLEQEYSESLKCIGNAHTQADEMDLGLEQKAAAMQEYSRRAEERYAAAIEKLKEERMLEQAECTKVIQARDLALAKEKMRARQVASLPPPIKPDLRKLLDKAKATYVQMTDADTYSYPYQLPADECLVERNDESVNDGLLGAEEQNVIWEEHCKDRMSNNSERLEKARVRGVHALKRERLRQDYNNMMTELDLLEKADRKHRQQNLEHIPQSLFLPAHVVMERETDRQTEMERKVEDLFADECDHLDLKASAPSLNCDTTPTVTETSGSSPSDSDPRPPVSKVRDGESRKARVPLQNLTNITTPTGTEPSDTETGSEKKRKVVLKKLMRNIKDQKDRWIYEEVDRSQTDHDDLVIPTHDMPEPPEEPAVVDVEAAEEAVNLDIATQSDTLSQVPEISTSENSDGQISQVRITSSEGETTTSSQFIERQRLELMEYMKSLESQIGQLETLKKDKAAIDRDETLAQRLERKLASQGLEQTSESDISGSHEQRSPIKIGQRGTDDHLARIQRYQDNLLGRYDERSENQQQINSSRTLGQTGSMERRPDETTWEWYLRQKASLGESIKQKLHQVTSSERGYELDSQLELSRTDDVLQQSPKRGNMKPLRVDLHQSPKRSYLQPAASDNLRTSNLISVRDKPSATPQRRSPHFSADNYFVTPDYTSIPGAEPHTRPHPPGYVSVTERELLARGQTPQHSSAKELGDSRLDSSYVGPAAPPPSHADELFVPVSERERLMRAPLSTDIGTLPSPTLRGAVSERERLMRAPLSTDIGTLPSPTLREDIPDQLQTDIAEHSKRLERLQGMMSSTRADRLVQSHPSTARSISQSILPHPITSQSRANLLPAQPAAVQSKPSYMSVEDREYLLRTLSHRHLARENGAPPPAPTTKPTWSDVLSARRAQDSLHAAQPRSGGAQSTPYLSSIGAYGPQPGLPGWSPVHQQMLDRQQEFNKRQEQLRRQLADIQEQKRKLLAPSDDRELYETQRSVRQALQNLGIDLTSDEEEDYRTAPQSTPSDRLAGRDRPPVTAKPGLDDLDFHELSIIQEVDTPTHFTTCDESTLLQSLNNFNANNRTSMSRSVDDALSTPISVALSQPIRSQEDNKQPISDRLNDIEPNADLYRANDERLKNLLSEQPHADEGTQSSQSFGETSGSSQAPVGAISAEVSVVEVSEAVSSPDAARIQVLTQLLEQLETRRVQRQSFLDKEKLTSLVEESQSSSDPGDKNFTERSPMLLDLYSSGSADDLIIPPPLSSTSTASTPSGETLTKQLHEINKEWINKPIPVPKHVAEGFTSSDSTTPSSEKLRRLYEDQMSGTGSCPASTRTISRSTTSTSGCSPRVPESPRVPDIEQILGTITSEGSGSRSGSAGSAFSQKSEHSSPSSREGEFTQVADPIPSMEQSDESFVTPSRAGVSTNPSIAESPMKSIVADHDQSAVSTENAPALDFCTPVRIASRPSSSTPNRRSPTRRLQSEDEMTGPLEEPEITFASTIADENTTLPEESHIAGAVAEEDEEFEPVVTGLQWVEDSQPTASAADARRAEASAAAARPDPPPDVRPKTTIRDVDSAARKRQQRDMAERTKRLYNQLDEVKERKAFRAREEKKIDVQARRKEYGNKLLTRSKKPS